MSDKGESKHTPGPWIWHDRSSDEWYANQDEGLIRAGNAEVCNFGNNETYYNTAGTKPSDADIALICAAPDLLEALEWAVSHFDGNTRCNAEQEANCIDKCKEVIAKATGTA